MKRQKFTQNVLNIKGVSEHFDWSDIIAKIGDYYTNFLASLRMSSKTGRSFIDTLEPYQRKLAFNLGIHGFIELPFHADLKVFELFKFPSTTMSKAASLALVLIMTKRVLLHSPLFKPLIGVVLDEAFLLLSGFRGFFSDSKMILLHFLQKGDIADAITLIAELKMTNVQFCLGLVGMTQQQCFEVSAALGQYLSANPQQYPFFKQLSSEWVLLPSFLCSDLAVEMVFDCFMNVLLL